MRKIDMIVVHCTATPEGKKTTVEAIRNQHVNVNHWKDIGYHYVIYLDGSIHTGRPVEQAGAHASGHNKNSIGICYVGGLDKYGKCKDTRTDMQKESLIYLIKELKKQFPTIYKVVGHRDLPQVNKCCPCFDAKKEYMNI